MTPTIVTATLTRYFQCEQDGAHLTCREVNKRTRENGGYEETLDETQLRNYIRQGRLETYSVLYANQVTKYYQKTSWTPVQYKLVATVPRKGK